MGNIRMKEVPHPGVYVKDALEALGMTAKEFSARTGISERMLSGIMTGNCGITFETAYQLSEFFDNSVTFWTNLQNQYDLYLKQHESESALEEDYQLVKGMKKYLLHGHYIEDNDDKITIVAKIRKAVGVNRLSLLNRPDPMVCFKEAKVSGGSDNFYQNFWIALALNEARRRDVPVYSKAKLAEALSKLRCLTRMEPEIFMPNLSDMFLESGICFVLLPYLPKSNIYGVTKWLNKDNVMLSVSNRGEKADVFWFTLCHEIAHVLMEHKREALISMSGLQDQQADAIAEDILIPREKWNSFVARGVFNAESIQGFADEITVHPCIVTGRLHKEKLVPYGMYDKRFALSYKTISKQ